MCALERRVAVVIMKISQWVALILLLPTSATMFISRDYKMLAIMYNVLSEFVIETFINRKISLFWLPVSRLF
jgi:hypothetical protein